MTTSEPGSGAALPLLRDRVREATAVLTVVSLALVFSAALGVVPEGLLPRAPDAVLGAIPPVNALISVVAIGTITAGWRAIRRGNVSRHARLMVSSFALFATFLVLYLYRVALLGPTPFPGPPAVEQFVYLPVLGIHILLAIVCVPLLYYVLLVAATRPTSEVFDSLHPRVGRVAASLWLVSFSLGVVVYAMLYVVY
jgi:putative membrane protein